MLEAIENLIQFILSYPWWARILLFINLVCIMATLVFAPHLDPVSDPQPKNGVQTIHEATENEYSLRIDRVELFPPSNTALIQVHIYISGTKFDTYPSQGGVEWLGVSPSMSGQTFRLPPADRYNVRFEMLRKEKDSEDTTRYLSQETIPFKSGTIEGKYQLYRVEGSSRLRTVETVIYYSIRPEN